MKKNVCEARGKSGCQLFSLHSFAFTFTFYAILMLVQVSVNICMIHKLEHFKSRTTTENRKVTVIATVEY